MKKKSSSAPPEFRLAEINHHKARVFRSTAPGTKALKPAGRLLVSGSGTGMASELEQFVAWLGALHPEIARRIEGTLRTDRGRVTDNQRLAMARDLNCLVQSPTR